MAVTAARLPGITFETRNPPVTTPLPRMDIAGFVGFAASGPIDVPVAVEDIPRFHDVFGEDIALALDQNAGGLAFAELPPAVRAFFRNGGVRCWVVRVAGPGAAVNRFLIPGLLTGPADKSDVGGALALARSAGSWSDALMVNATLTQRPLPVSAISPPGAGPFRVTGLSEGDLIRLEYPDCQIVAFQPVPASDDRPPLSVAVPSADAYWFRRVARADIDLAFGSPPDPIAWLPAPVNIRWLAGAVPPDFDPDVPIARWGVRDEGFIVELDRLALGGIQPGSWLHVTVTTAPAPAKPRLVLLVDSVQAAMPDSPPASGEPVWVTATQAWWILDAAAAQLNVAAATPQASVVTFELWARDPVEATRRLADLGCAAPTPLYWGDVPDDDLVFRRDDRRPSRLDQIAPQLLNRVVIPRYPLAAPRPRDAKQLPVFLPLAITALPRDEFYQPALPIAGDRLTRDGLAAFETPLFIDRDLADVTSTNLMTEAFQIQYVDPAAGSTRAVGRDLTGLHALLPIDEVSMIAVPDAIQRAWSPEPTTMLPLTAPALVAVLADANTVHVEWQPLAPPAPIDEEQLSYMAQASLDPQFDRVAASWPVDGTTLDHPASLFPFCTAAFYRVRAMSSIRGTGPWSNTRWVELPSSVFAPNPDDRPPAPEPLAVSETRGRLRAEWTYAAGVDAAFTLERAVDPEFVSAAVVYSGPAASCEVVPRAQPPVYFHEVLRGAEPVVYFRVAAAVGGHQSPWSATAITGVLNTAAAVTESTDHYDDRALLDIDKALIRMCAGRGDAHAILGLPSHFRTDAASDLLTRLSHDLDRDDGLKVLSYAAVFYPWIVVRETAGRADLSTWPMVPDGSVCGTIAARTLRNGAWYSVANQFFEGALALQPVLDDSTLQLLATRINPIVQQPRGFAAVDAMTLYPDDELGDLHVRRLLILLRRLALREGNGFVFANNDDSLRRLVQREFGRVLGDLFVHGAFAGTTHDEGYQVVTGSSVNTPESIDAGRFIVELRVAPSQPLTFLTVRLIQEGGAVVAEEL